MAGFVSTPGPTLAIIAMTASAALSAVLIVAIRPLLQRYALARPNSRSSHDIPTPQGAGIAVIAATIVSAGIAITIAFPGSDRLLLLLFGATLLIAAVGAIDDLKPIPVAPRLILQVCAIALVFYAMPPDVRIVPWLPAWLERMGLLIAALWFVNLVNFMDGLDWMSVAEVVPICGALVVLGALGLMPWPAVLVAAALGGALAGFAPFNRPVAKVFLGDVGSLPIGLLLGWCLLELAMRGHLAAAILLPLYYLADATVTLLRRIVKRESFWIAHRTHFYQRATDHGFSVLRVVSEVFVLNIALGLLAVADVLAGSTFVDALLLLAGLALVTIVLMRFSKRRIAIGRRP